MTNNDIFRRLRYILHYNDSKMRQVFSSAEYEVQLTQIQDWLHKTDHPDYREMSDKDLAAFLNGVINEKRGKREGPQMPPEKNLSNNIILRKLKIALNLRDEDMMAIFKKANVNISKHELSAFFRKPDQKQYRECMDQYLRNFLFGLQQKVKDDNRRDNHKP